MRKIRSGSYLFGGLAGAVGAALMAFPASAADLQPRPYTAPPPIPAPIVQVYNWTGFYIGGHLGGAFSGDNGLSGDGRFLGGVQLGADYQFASNWVAGIEAQYSWLNGGNSGINVPPNVDVSLSNRGIGSVTGRFGYAIGPTLLYAKGGYAYSDRNVNVSWGGAPASFTVDPGRKDGWTAGAGLEYMFAPNWSAKVEYQYYNFGNVNFVDNQSGAPIASYRNDEHTVKAGVNYRFNWGGPQGPRY